MKINAGKCGIMHFPARTRPSARTEPIEVKVGNDVVPYVSEYTYLGLKINEVVSPAAMAKGNQGRGAKTLGSLAGVLRRRNIPVLLKRTLMNSLLVPVLTYGGEIWGMNTERARPLQKILDAATRLAVCAPANASLGRLHCELGRWSIDHLATAKRARAFHKFRTLTTWIADLATKPARSRFTTWVTGTPRWMKVFKCDGGERPGVKRRLLNLYTERAARKDHTMATRWASQMGFVGDPSWIRLGLSHPTLSRGLYEVGRMRMGYFPTAKKLVYARALSPEFVRKCPLCLQDCPESLEHLLLTCPRWKQTREQILKPLFQEWDEMVVTPTAVILAVSVLLGGEQGIDEHRMVKVKFSGEAGADMVVLATARYLSEIIPTRRKILCCKKPESNVRASSWNQGHSGTVALGEL